MNDKSGESMEPMEEVPLRRLVGESEIDRLVHAWLREATRSRDVEKHTGRNDLLYAEKMM